MAIAKIKINIKSLSAEARANRKEAAGLTGMDKWEINHHRTTKLRSEARVAQWLYAFARGIPRSVIETKPRSIPDYLLSVLLRRIASKSKTIGVDVEYFQEWLSTE